MEERWIVGDFLTGTFMFDIPVASGSTWSEKLGETESITMRIPMGDSRVARLNPAENILPWRHFIGVSLGGKIMAAGPVIVRDWEHETRTLVITAKGISSYWNRRYILPAIAKTQPLYDDVNFKPNPVTQTNATGSYRKIVNQLLRQALQWDHVPNPIVFDTDLAGTIARHWDGIELVNLGDVLQQITELDDGVDIRFRARWSTNDTRVVWDVQTGTTSAPLLAGTEPVVWDTTRKNVNLTDFKVNENGENLTTRVYVPGGVSVDEPLIAIAANEALMDSGLPLLEEVDSSHSSEEALATLQGYANAHIKINSRPVVSCTFSVRADGDPQVTSYEVGDWVLVITEGVPLLPKNLTQMRLLGRSGEAGKPTLGLSLAPVREEHAWLPADV